ncbi:MAG: hypothetical protein N2171_01515, partial [Clostridia bacterium]|nr:hypothetical protein [Clostridia bacterium]
LLPIGVSISSFLWYTLFDPLRSPPVTFVCNLSITGFDPNGYYFLYLWAIYFTTCCGILWDFAGFCGLKWQ